MKKLLTSEVGAIIFWALGSLAGAAILAPWFHLWGKQLASACEQGTLPGIIEWLGAACGRAKFERFFNRAMILTALALMPLLIARVRKLRRNNPAPIMGLQSADYRTVIVQVICGALIAGGILWATGMLLVEIGAFQPQTREIVASNLIKRALIPAVVVSLLEEWLFRGLMLGLWLRTATPLRACIGSSLLFAFLHFLKPPGGVADPNHPLAGFELLSKILLHFTEAQFFVTDFATLTVVGLILCWARLRTRSLWFPIGLHAGWVFAYAAFNLYYNMADHPLHPWGVGDNLRSGIVPLLALALTALACRPLLAKFSSARLRTDSKEA